ncbi:MAG: tripartite tricarboxylate transporter substrate binding protein [Rhizobiales bacterium]|jgi:tripartite-type tricarboxylate transporter receptor subunit TctC|nr:tripartite tricarboxylate transporter substrate binding protein [Hyphomicrobiales bacterium]
MLIRRSFLAAVMGGAVMLTGGTTPSLAQTAPAWPTRTVKFILTLGAGSGTDIGARLLADRLTKKWGQPVVIENRPGGDGIVAINAFVSAKDDHILLMSPTSAFIAHPWVHDSVPYKVTDLAPIARVSNTIIGISVPKSSPVNSMEELVKLAKSKPGELNWAGVTGALDFNFAAWLKNGGIDMKKVPYRNPVEAANDLATNRVQVYESAVAIAQPQIQAGNIKLLAVVNTSRAPIYPNIPTVAEAGQPALTIDGLVGLFGPPTMPLAQREKIAADVKAVMEGDPIIKDRLNATAQMFNPGGPEDFAKSIQSQRDLIAKNAADLGIKTRY